MHLWGHYAFVVAFLAAASRTSLLVVIPAAIAALARLRALAAHATRAATAERRRQGEVDVFLAVKADEERRDVADLFAHADVTLTDQHTGVVDGLGEAQLEHLRLEPPLHDLRRGQPQDVIELLLTLQEEPQAH